MPETIKLDKLQFYSRRAIPDHELNMMKHMEFESYRDYIIYDMAQVIVAKFKPWGETRREWTYPETWLDAVKERFFPKWLLKRYPAKLVHVKFGFIYPDIAPVVDSKVSIALTWVDEYKVKDGGVDE